MILCLSCLATLTWPQELGDNERRRHLFPGRRDDALNGRTEQGRFCLSFCPRQGPAIEGCDSQVGVSVFDNIANLANTIWCLWSTGRG